MARLADFEVGKLVLVSWSDPTSRPGRYRRKQRLARWRSVGWVVEKRRDDLDTIVLSAHRCTPTGREHFEDPTLIPVGLITDVLEIEEPDA